MLTRITSRRAALAIAVVAAATLGTPAAQAATPATAVTKTNLTPYDVYDSSSRYGTINRRTISGTASGLSGSAVDLVCLNVTTGAIDTRIASGVTVTAGKWSTTFSTRDISGYRCRVAAIETQTMPEGANDAERLTWGKAFKSAAPLYQVWEKYYYFVHLGGAPSNVLNYSSYYYSPTPNSEIVLYGADQGGINRFSPRNAAGTTDYGVFGAYYGRANLSTFDNYVRRDGTDIATLLVDGAQAFTNYSMYDRGDDDNFVASSSTKTTYSVDAKTGAATVTDEYPLFKCTKPVSGTVYDGASRCPDYATTKLGVVWSQTRSVNATGNTIKVVNSFISTDKKAHTVRMIQRDRMKAGGFRYGTSGAFGDFNGDQRTNVTGYGAKVDTSKATAFDNSIGQVIFSAKATTWASSGYNGNEFYAQFTVSVKAGKSAGYNAAYTIITDDTKAAAQITAALK